MDKAISRNIQIIIITGMSGSGKSTALRAFEDLGYYCVDNLPIALLPEFLALTNSNSQNPTNKIALVMDVREKDFLDKYESIFKKVKEMGAYLEVLFLDASDNVLIQRYSQTRRRHPLQSKGDILTAINEERSRLRGLREFADNYIDTTNKNVHELRQMVLSMYSTRDDLTKPLIHVISFGFKYGVPPDASLVFDVRFLPNPYFVDELRPLSGLDEGVFNYVLEKEPTREFIARLESLLIYLLPQYYQEGKVYLVIGIGCTGGRHRSVAIAKWLGDVFKSRGEEVLVTHRDLNREG